MTCEEIFSKLDARRIKGMMFHQQMADYFDFLNLKGYSCLHRHRFMEETKSLAKLHNYYISKSVENGKTFTHIKQLDERAKIMEIARLSGGLSGELAENHAKQLILEIKG